MNDEATGRTARERVRAAIPAWIVGPAAVLGFVVAVQLLGGATATLAPLIEPALRRSLEPAVAGLGAAWLLAYATLNGSVVAALAISLAEVGLVSGRELFLLVVGSRLGAAGMVVVVGAIDHLQRRDEPLRESVALGLLTFLVTDSIYLPVALLGYVTLPFVAATSPSRFVWLDPLAIPMAPIVALVEWTVGAVGGPAALVLAVALFVASLRALDRLFVRLDAESVEAAIVHVLANRWRSFAVGLVATAVTTSVAVSIGIAVPLYNRGIVSRRQMVPYVLGASLGTLSDTLLVAVVLGSTAGVLTVVHLFAVGLAVTLIALAGFDRYVAAIDRIVDRLLADVRLFDAFFVLLVAVPLGLVALALLS